MSFVITVSSPLRSFIRQTQLFERISFRIELFSCFFHVQIEVAQNKVLSGSNDRFTILRTQNVVGTEHQNFRLSSCHFTQRQMDSHLVTVEVSIECRTYERMYTDCMTFNQFREEGLDTQSVQCRCTVQEYRVSVDDLFNNVPYTRFLSVDQLFSCLRVAGDLLVDQFVDNERLVQLDSHFSRQSALIHLQCRSDGNNGTA